MEKLLFSTLMPLDLMQAKQLQEQLRDPGHADIRGSGNLIPLAPRRHPQSLLMKKVAPANISGCWNPTTDPIKT